MLFRKEILDGIQQGQVDLAFRRWKRPTVKSGGSLLTPIGNLNIQSVLKIEQHEISEIDAQQAGYNSLDTLILALDQRSEGDLYRIEFGSLEPDRRIILQAIPAKGTELDELIQRLELMDARSRSTAWTFPVLKIIQSHPGIYSGDLCKNIGQEKNKFKRNVRKLKELGLTVSLKIGYQLSPRGEALLDSLDELDKQS